MVPLGLVHPRDRQFPMVPGFRWHLLFPKGQQYLWGRIYRLVLLRLLRHSHRRFLMGQRFLLLPMFPMVRWLLSPPMRQQFRMVPLYLEDPMNRTVLLHLWLRTLRLCRKVRLSLAVRLIHSVLLLR
jgi:hypothetical protein